MDYYPTEGAYSGRRAASLAGVPYSTLQYWARKGKVVPSVSSERVRYWSWEDLLKLRAVTWLRSRKVPMSGVLEAFRIIDELGLHSDPRNVILASHARQVFLWKDGVAFRADAGRQVGDPETLDLVAPFGSGPDLLEPRETIRILPGKLHGEPHVIHTRIASRSLFALVRSGYSVSQVVTMYGGVLDDVKVDQAIDLEIQLAA